MIKQKKYWIAITIICGIILLGGLALYKHNNPSNPDMTIYLKEDKKLMDTMMEEMSDIPKSGDAAIDFLYGMIPHHESAVDMSKNYLQYGGENEDLKRIAEDIINVQVSEIDDMMLLIKQLEENIKIDEDKENNYLSEYNKTSNHDMSHSTFKNVDEAFAKGMIIHHQMAIDMSKAILKYTDNETIINMAENIITVQEEEIEEMENIIKTIK